MNQETKDKKSPPNIDGLWQTIMNASRNPHLSGGLTPLEQRILQIVNRFFSDMMGQARMRRWSHGGELPPLTDEDIETAVRWSLLAAIEIEKPLRDIVNKAMER